MDISKLIRNPSKIIECLIETIDDRVVTSKELKISIPTRFIDRELAYIGVQTHIVGICGLILDDMFYATMNILAMINIEPSETNRIKIDNDQYFEFVFKPGSTVFKSTNLIKSDLLPYKIYDEILSNGNVPWFMSYEDVGKLFDTAVYHAGANIGENKEVTELIASLVSRDPIDKTKYFRVTIDSLDDLKKKKPVFIGLKNVVYSATNTVNRLGGSYFSQGVVASLVNPAVREEKIELILKS